jgi:hypothetical protein
MTAQLTDTQRSTYEAVFQHPVPRRLEWRDVRDMLGALPDMIQQELNGILTVTCHGTTQVLHGAVHKSVASVQEVMNLRRFLERSGTAAQKSVAAGAHLLVVIDHREARIYRTEVHGSVPQRITPYDPEGFGRRLRYVQDDSNGQRKPERKSFYDAVTKTLAGAARILVFGSSTGASSAMEQLLIQLRRHHPDVAERVVGAIVVDEQHLTEDQLLARAREFYATAPQNPQGAPAQKTKGVG